MKRTKGCYLILIPGLLLNKNSKCPVTITYDRDQANNGQYPVNTIATFMCDSEYHLDGDLSATCQPSGNWSQQPICRGNDIKQ